MRETKREKLKEREGYDIKKERERDRKSRGTEGETKRGRRGSWNYKDPKIQISNRQLVI